jgi:predicted flap endonuclease-1-like 5' DNA nuclease
MIDVEVHCTYNGLRRSIEEDNMMSITKIEGIGASYASKLRRVGVRSTKSLLKAGANKRGRADLSKRTGISETLILEWVNLADLMRIKGIGEEYSDLLEEAGVDTVKELRVRRPDNLYQALVKANKEKRLVRRIPSQRAVKNWVQQAKKLPPLVTH